MKAMLQGAIAVALTLAAFTVVGAQEMPEAFPLEQLLARASVDGKYSHLLRAIEVEEDFDDYGRFHDYGYWNGDSWRGHTELPAGYWVYLYPCWYIWGECDQAVALSPNPWQHPITVSEPDPSDCCECVVEEDLLQLGNSSQGRSWGPEQATGPPDTEATGSIRTAWASHTADGRDEWLFLSYAEPVVPLAVVIYEQHCPGAVYRVTAVDAAGRETELWSGDDPASRDEGKGISVLVPQVSVETQRIAVYLKSSEVAGWNEIDAVGLLDAAGTVHWATGAHASTNYADATESYDTIADLLGTTVNADALEALEQRVRELEEELSRLRSQID